MLNNYKVTCFENMPNNFPFSWKVIIGTQNVGHEKGKYWISVIYIYMVRPATIDNNDQEIKGGIQASCNNMWQTRGVPKSFRLMLFENHMDTSIIYILKLYCSWKWIWNWMFYIDTKSKRPDTSYCVTINYVMWIPGLKKKVQNLVFFFHKMYIIAIIKNKYMFICLHL